MKTLLKARTVAALLASSLLVGGCTNLTPSSTTQPSTQPAAVNQSIINDEPIVRLGASLATSATLLQISPSDRVKFGSLAYEVASQVETSLTNNTINVADVSALVQTAVLAKVPGAYQVEVTALIAAITDAVNAQTLSLGNVSQSDQAAAIRVLTIAAVQGVESATVTYKSN